MAEGRFNNFRNVFITMPPFVKILFVILIVFLFLFLSSALSMVLAMPFFGVGIGDIFNAISNPEKENLYLVKYFQVVQTIFAFIVPAVFAAWIFSLDTFDYLKAKSCPSFISFVLVLLLMLAAIPFLNAVTALNAGLNFPEGMDKLEQYIVNLEESAIRLTELFVSMDNIGELAFNLIMIAVLPAIGEELLFRGVLQNLFIEWSKNKHIGIFLAAFVFSFFHLQFFGFLPRLLLGIYLGYLLVISGSIWLPVAGHFINNALIIIYYYFTSEPAGETFLERIGTERGAFYIAALSLLLTTLMFMIIYRQQKKEVIT